MIITISKRVKCVCFMFFLLFLFVYFLISLTANAVKNEVAIVNRLAQINNVLMANNKDPTEYLNVTVFNQFIDENCPVEGLNKSYECLRAVNSYDLSNPVYINDEIKLVHYHTFWNFFPESILEPRIMRLSILSYLATQNLLHTKLIIWTLKPLSRKIREPLVKEFETYFVKYVIEFRVINFTNLCSNGVFKKHYKMCIKLQNPSNVVAYSDFIRFLVLYTYGGIYTDGDVIYLKDLKPFWYQNFAYRWSYLSDYNTAVIGLKKHENDPFIDDFFKILMGTNKSSGDFIYSFHPFHIRFIISDLNNGKMYTHPNFKIYHSALFDPNWLCNDGVIKREKPKAICGFEDFYDLKIKKSEFNINNFFAGAFTYHLHLVKCGSCNVTYNSYFFHLEKYFESKVFNSN